MITDIQLKNAKPKDKDYTIKVDSGLTLLVKKNGAKLWRYRYSYAGKRGLISVGKYPQITIKQARAKQQEYSELLEKGINPSTHKRTEKVRQVREKTFKEVAEEWFTNKYQGQDTRYNRLVWARLTNHAFPKIGLLPIKDIDAPMLFNVIESIQGTGHIVTGKRVNGVCSMVFRYGVAKGYLYSRHNARLPRDA